MSGVPHVAARIDGLRSTTWKVWMFKNGVKTVVLLAGIGVLFMAVGSFFGQGGLVIGLALGVLFVGGSYWFSDKLAVRAAGATPVSESEAPKLYAIVRDLTSRTGMPMPADLSQPRGAAERVRDRPQPPARRGRRHARAAPSRRRRRAARRARPRALARRQPRHPDHLGRGRSRHGHHVRRPHGDVGRHVRRPRRWRRPARPRRPEHPRRDRDDDLRPDRRRHVADGAVTLPRVRSRPQRRRAPRHRRAPRRARSRRSTPTPSRCR